MEPKAKRKRGRPTKLTPELIERVAGVVRVGNYLDTAARYCGIDKVTFYSWMKRGHAQRSGIFRDFLNALEEAQAAADVRDHAHIAKASQKDWRAAAEHLRLRNQSRYNRSSMEVSGPDGQPVQVQHTAKVELGPERLQRVAMLLERVGALEALRGEVRKLEAGGEVVDVKPEGEEPGT